MIALPMAPAPPVTTAIRPAPRTLRRGAHGLSTALPVIVPASVTGASGHVGRYAVHQLVARGVQVREADYSRPQTLGAALARVDRLLLVSGSQAGQPVAQHSNVIWAAKGPGLAHPVHQHAQRR